MRIKAKRILKYSLILIFSSLIIITSGASVFVYFYPEEKVLELIKEASGKALDRPVEIDSIKYTFKGILLSDIQIHESADKADNKLLLRADEALITFSLFSLLGDEIDIWSIYLKGMKINWRFNRDWTGNFQKLAEELSAKASADSEVDSGRSVNLSRIVLENCALTLENLPDKIKPLEGEYKINSTVNVNKSMNLKLSDTEITLPHRRGKLYPQVTVNLDKNFTATGKVEVSSLNLPWTYKFGRLPHLSLPFETVNAVVYNFELTEAGVKGRAKGTCTLKNSSKIAHVDGWCYVGFKNLEVAISDAKGKVDETSLTLNNLTIDADRGIIKKFKASDISADISDLKIMDNSLPPGRQGC